MVGHFPMRCYPADGWDFVRAEPRDWQVGDLRLTGMEYEFFMREIGDQISGEQRIVVANCLLRPGGLVLRDMDSLSNPSSAPTARPPARARFRSISTHPSPNPSATAPFRHWSPAIAP